MIRHIKHDKEFWIIMVGFMVFMIIIILAGIVGANYAH